MRTSPLGMRRRLRRAPHLLPALVLLATLGAACSDGDDAGDSSPTTTSPSTTEATDGGEGDGDTGQGDDATTTEGDGPEGTEPDGGSATGPVAGDDVDVLTAEQAEAQLDALVGAYADALAGIASTRALDERALASLHGAFSGARAQQELDALREVGAEVLAPTPVEVSVTDVDLTRAVSRCASGTVVVDGLARAVTPPVEVAQPYHFRLVPAADGAAAPAWRLDFFNFSDNGVPLTEEAACP